jgi:hypothetical protein
MCRRTELFRVELATRSDIVHAPCRRALLILAVGPNGISRPTLH